MQKDDLKCLLIGQEVKIYNDLARLVREIDTSSRFKQVELNKASIINALKKMKGPSLIFVSDEISFSLEKLSDLVWHYNADATVVILTKKAQPFASKKPFNNTQFARLKLSENTLQNKASLQFIIQSSREKAEMRRCKSLLGVSEKRCKWLVDSSKEAVAFISRDMHWYANTSYLDLFEISSVQELRTVTVKDLIVKDEHNLFDEFLQNQKNTSDKRRSIMLSMKKSNGANFRAYIYAIPSVYKGYKCLQLWARKVNTIENEIENKNDIEKNTIELNKDISNEKISISKTTQQNENDDINPFSKILKQQPDDFTKPFSNKIFENPSLNEKPKIENPPKVESKSSYSYNSLLKGVINRKEAKLVVNPLSYLKEGKIKKSSLIKHQIVSLKVAAAQKKGVDELLAKLPENFDQKMRPVFWDKVKFSRLLKTLAGRRVLPMKLLVRVSEESIVDEAFIQWLTPGLKRLGKKSKKLVILIPATIAESEYRTTLQFIFELRKYHCQVALDSFSISSGALTLLKYTKPDYVRLSLPWVRQLHGNEGKENILSSAIRQIESRNIKIISPCGFSKDMRRLFVLSGASFCQEKAIKTA